PRSHSAKPRFYYLGHPTGGCLARVIILAPPNRDFSSTIHQHCSLQTLPVLIQIGASWIRIMFQALGPTPVRPIRPTCCLGEYYMVATASSRLLQQPTATRSTPAPTCRPAAISLSNMHGVAPARMARTATRAST